MDRKARSVFFFIVCLLLVAVAFGGRVSPGSFPAASASRLGQGTRPWAYLPAIFNGIGGPTLADCPIFPYDNIWNTPVDKLPVHSRSAQYINNIGFSRGFHADFGSGLWDGGPIGIPFIVVPASQPTVPIEYIWFDDESDPGPFPIPPNAPVEGGADNPVNDGDRHVLVLQSGTCMLYELYYSYRQPNGSWEAGSGAKYNLLVNGPLRPDGWTSADAAGLPIFPGLVRYDEVAAGEIRHAIRFTTNKTQGAYVWPARHEAGDYGVEFPPMGQRFRLNASFNVASAPAQVQVILRAMQKYGIILADNGSPWYISGVPDERWDNDQLRWIGSHLHGSDFEAVDSSSLMINPDSGQAKRP